MTKIIRTFSVRRAAPLSCVWIETGNPAQPLTCKWTADRDSTPGLPAIAVIEPERRRLCA